MKTIISIFLCPLLISCSPKNTDNIQWYQNQIIEQVIKETDSTYIVQLGIMAQAFRLDKKTTGFENKLQLLQESLSNRKKIDIGVEKGSAKIISIRK